MLAYILFLSTKALAASSVSEPTEGSYWINIISQVGFPIMVSTYLLMDVSKKLTKLITLQTAQMEILRIRGDEDDSK